MNQSRWITCGITYQNKLWSCFPGIIQNNAKWQWGMNHPGMQMFSYRWVLVSFGSGNGLLPDNTKPLPEPFLTYQWCLFSHGQMRECYSVLGTVLQCHISVTIVCRVDAKSDICSAQNSLLLKGFVHDHGPLTKYAKLQIAHAPGMLGKFPLPLRISDPDMHHSTCDTHVL